MHRTCPTKDAEITAIDHDCCKLANDVDGAVGDSFLLGKAITECDDVQSRAWERRATGYGRTPMMPCALTVAPLT